MLENFIISCLKNNIDILLFALDSDVASIIYNKYNIDIIQYGDEFCSILKNKFNVTINLNNFIQYNTYNFRYISVARFFIINKIWLSCARRGSTNERGASFQILEIRKCLENGKS